MNTYCIYHEVKKGVPCGDGLAAAWVVTRAIHEAIPIGCVYGDPIPDRIEDGDRVIIVDFSFSAAEMEALADRGCEVIVIDHHKTAWENFQNLSDRIYYKFDLNDCGATLAWKHFFPDRPIPAFLQYVRDRDLWIKELPCTEEIHAVIGFIGRSFNLYSWLSTLKANQLQEVFEPFGEMLLAEKRERIAKIVCNWEFIQVGDHLVPGVRLTPDQDYLTSDICQFLYSVLLDERAVKAGSQFVCCVTSDGTYSLRSDKNGSNFDVGSLAKSLGGGGHFNAAGYRPRASSTVTEGNA